MYKQEVTYKREKMSITSAIDLMSIANTEEAEELFKAIQKVSPSKAIQAREIRRLTQQIKQFRETRASDSDNQSRSE